MTGVIRWKRDFRLGRLRIHVWKPKFHTKFGKHHEQGMHTLSLRYFMLRWWMSRGRHNVES